MTSDEIMRRLVADFFKPARLDCIKPLKTTAGTTNMTTGTSYFVSVRAARRYYAAYGHSENDVLHKIINKEIHIGKPPLKPGERLVIVDNETGKRWDGRYAIEATKT